MRISEENISLFEAYNAGTLDEKARSEFESRLSYDSEFKGEYATFLQLEKGIKHHFKEEAKKKLSALDEELDKELISEKPRSLVKRLWIPTVAAAVVAFLFFNPFSNHAALAEKYWEKDPGLPVKMSTQGRYDAAMNDYKLKNWDASLEKLKTIESDTSYFYQGHILYYSKDYVSASLQFSKVHERSVYFEKSCFAIALILIKEEKISEAKTLLKALISNGSSYSAKAEKLLSEI